jgi:hypothetical protein
VNVQSLLTLKESAQMTVRCFMTAERALKMGFVNLMESWNVKLASAKNLFRLTSHRTKDRQESVF